MKAVILAAGMATRLRPYTLHVPKCLLKVGGRSLLQRSMDALIQAGVSRFVIVTGYLHEKIEQFVEERYRRVVEVTFVNNSLFESTNNIYSLWLARKEADGEDVLLLDSDLLYDPSLIPEVLACGEPNVLTLVRHELGEEEMKVVTDASGAITGINKTCDPSRAAGESLGIELMGKEYTKSLYAELERMMNEEHLEDKFYELAFERLIRQGQTFKVFDVTKFHPCELDTVEDFDSVNEKMRDELS